MNESELEKDVHRYLDTICNLRLCSRSLGKMKEELEIMSQSFCSFEENKCRFAYIQKSNDFQPLETHPTPFVMLKGSLTESNWGVYKMILDFLSYQKEAMKDY